jgi:CrcB protein
MPTSAKTLIMLATAGGAGALSRYFLAAAAQRLFPMTFPGGTFVVNMLGCLLFGLVWGILEERELLDSQWRYVLLVGFMGAFTTFSTFAFESAGLMQSGRFVSLLLNLLGQNVLGIICVLAGISLSRGL